MGKNVIVSEETIKDLLEAHAALSAWYYQLWSALRAANGTARSPDDAARSAFVERLATDFPEIAAVAKQIKVPRMFVPAPPAVPIDAAKARGPAFEEPATLIEPAQARVRESNSPRDPPPEEAAPGVVPPPIVKPGSVKY